MSAQERELGVGGLNSRYIQDLMESIGDPSAPDWEIGPLMDDDKLSLGDHMRSRGASDGAVQLLRVLVVGHHASTNSDHPECRAPDV